MGNIKEEEKGSVLLKLFREEQAINFNIGCECTTCEADMQRAYERFKELDK